MALAIDQVMCPVVAGLEPGRRRDALSQFYRVKAISEEDMQRPEKVTHIEVILEDSISLENLRYFSALQSVCLIQQGITTIYGLEDCPHLKKIVLNENMIQQIEGVRHCSRLRSLYICGNAIKNIGDGLCGLDELELLWLTENRITNLVGLVGAPNITELNVSRNHLASLEPAFQGMSKLRSLNLSHNRLCSCRDVLECTRLPALQELSFSDPQWGDNPLCELSNYQTCILYHIPSIEVCDQRRVTEEDRQSAENAFAKTRIYYSMRMQLVSRQAVDATHAAQALYDEETATIVQGLEDATRALKRLEGFQEECRRNPPEALSAEAKRNSAPDKNLISTLVRKRQSELAESKIAWNALIQCIREEKEAATSALHLELWTSGNVRLESGEREKEVWATQIQELVKARFHASDFKQLGIADISINTITRIHNRGLQLRADEVKNRLLPTTHLQREYLFYVPDPGSPLRDIRAVAEEGFTLEGDNCNLTETQGDKLVGSTPFVLTNSVSVAEATHFASLTKVRKAAGSLLIAHTGLPVRRATLLLCNARLEGQCVDEPAEFDERFSIPRIGDIPGDPRKLWQLEPSTALTAVGLTPYRTRAGNPSQRIWLVTRSSLVLPEYFVEFEYVFTDDCQSAETPRLNPNLGPFNNFINDYALRTKLSAQGKAIEDPSILKDSDRLTPFEELGKGVTTDEGNLILLKIVLKHSLAIANMQVMNLHGRGICRIELGALDSLVNLRSLLLSFNSIESVSCIPRLPLLEHLDMSFNLVQRIDAFKRLPALQTLDISWNTLLSFDCIATLGRVVPAIQELRLSGNPIAKDPKYKPIILSSLTCLKLLDTEEVPSHEDLKMMGNLKQHSTLSEAALFNGSYATMSCHRRVELLVRSSAKRTSMDWDAERSSIPVLVRNSKSHGLITHTNWKAHVDCLDLRNLGISELCSLHGFSQVRRVLLGGNQLTSIHRLASCADTVEELSVEDAGLDSLRGVSALVHLTRLYAGCNQITDVHECGQLSRLTQLSLEDNEIDSLDSFMALQNLVELYLSNNLIEDVRAVLKLKPLVKLIVLDLSGNPACSSMDYRLYTLFHLRRLKVLDGEMVLVGEQQEADTRFGGRLTAELIEEKLGAVPAWYNLRSVDVSSQGLRDLGNMLVDDFFPSLRELTLDSNPVTDIKHIGPLPKLLVLRMNKTKINLEKGMMGDDGKCGIAALPNLQVLEMAQCGITDISHFRRFLLTNLRILHIPGNEISRVEGLSHLEQLRELVLDRNKVRQFDEQSFKGLRALREFRADDNGLRSLSHLGPLPRVRSIHLALNRVAELDELENLGQLKQVVSIHLEQNPVARKPLYRAHIIGAAACVRYIDGSEVTESEREKCEQLLQAADASKMRAPAQALVRLKLV